MAQRDPTPDTPSDDYRYMLPYWNQVEAILGGICTIRNCAETYLPRFPSETGEDYDFRLKCTKFTNIFRDIVEGLAAKPFCDEAYVKEDDEDEGPPVATNPTITPPPAPPPPNPKTPFDGAAPPPVNGATPPPAPPPAFGTLPPKPPVPPTTTAKDTTNSAIVELSEDIDGCGNHIHVFAGEVFFNGIANAIDWILVDYTKGVPPQATRKEEAALAARPYWVRIPAKNLLAAYSDLVEGTEQFVHVRIMEDYCVRDGYTEKYIKRVRILDRPLLKEGKTGTASTYGPATWEVWEAEVEEGYTDHGSYGDTPGMRNAQLAAAVGGINQEKWAKTESGSITIGVIPLVPFVTGRRKGSSWRLDPPLRDSADLQVDLYQQESALKYAKTMTAFPMLTGNGVQPDLVNGIPRVVPVSPKTVLYSPPGSDGNHGTWSYIEPSSQSLTFLAADIKETTSQLRELGRQPLTAQTGNLTVVTTAFAAQKGNSAIQAWALNLKDCIENALMYTALWLDDYDPEHEPEFIISVDFDIDIQDDKSPDVVNTMRQNGDLSQRTYWHEMRRRGILSPEFDADAEEEALMAEVPEEPTMLGEPGAFPAEPGVPPAAPFPGAPQPPAGTNGATPPGSTGGVPVDSLSYDQYAPY